MSEAEQSREPQGDKDGRLLAGRYRLGEVLGRGGMGTVWRAADETLGRTVAVKELRFPSAIDDDEKRRLITRTLREAKAIARIRNTSAVTVYDVVDEDDRPWIVMELIEGKSLAEVIREDGTLTPRRAAEVGLAILDVLRSAHREGILHRDVKPSNVLISEDGRVVLTDFGIAQVEGDPSVTSTGMLVGAPSYISPERARGHKPGPPADLWSLGGLLYASVEGRPPYDKGSAIATLTAVMTEPVEPPANAGPLEEVIYGLLARDPDERLSDAGARVLLNAVINAPERPAAPPADSTQVMALPTIGDAKSGKSDKGGRSGRNDPRGGGRKAAAAAAVVPTPAGEGGGPGGAAGSGMATGGSATGGSAPAGRTPGPSSANAAAGMTAIAESTRDRLRGALRSVRNAKSPAAAGAVPPVPSRAPGTPAATASVSGAATPPGRPAGTRASITDVVPRRTLAVIAGVVVLAVLGTVLAITLGEDETGNEGGSKGGTAASAGATAGGDAATGGGAGKDEDTGTQDGGKDGQGEDKGEASGDASPPPETEPTPDPDALPAGYRTVTNKQFHFSVAMPGTFKFDGIAGQNSGAIYNADGGFPRIQIDYNSSPKDDAAAAWAAAVAATRSLSNGYKHLGIKKVEYNGYPTVADWEFTRTQRGVPVHVLNRGFKVDATHGYSIMISCKADAWDGEECRTLRETAYATFEPTD
ncbi:serine/threonine-protein kinase [Streptomyces mutomycini]|uniref:serine/threonine-protein kinase n=1 Tax=Streptomyces mutomycini TaxID=284036 RepID=UPI0033C11F88